MKHLRIGMFTDVYKPSINGVTRSVDTFRESLEARGHEVYIFAPAALGEPPEEKVIRLTSVSELSPEGFPIGLPILPTVRRLVEPLNLDLVHSHLPFFVGQLGHRAAKKLHLPEVHTYHTHLTEYAHYAPVPFVAPFVRQGLKRLSRNFCNNADVVIAPSTSIKKLLKDYGVKSPIVVNPTGVECRDFVRLSATEKEKLFDKYKISKHEQTIVFGGRLAKEKNLFFLLSAFEKIIARNPKAHLIFAGGGPVEEDLRNEVRNRKLDRQVSITGFLTKLEIAKFMGSADVFAFPSLTETQGIVILEAMSAGAPVVAINALGPKDLVTNGKDGFLTPDNLNKFSNKIETIIRDEILRHSMSDAATRKAHDFSIQNTTDKLLDIYEQATEISTK